MGEHDRVRIAMEGGVADVQLHRPEKINALDPEMFDALGRAVDAVAGDPGVRAVVLSGAGRGFCSGLDVAALGAMAGGDGRFESGIGHRPEGQMANRAQKVAFGWSELAVPVIAAVHGVALGGGLQIALGADIRIVAPDARLSVLEIRWGLVPDMSGTVTLPRSVRLDVAKELTWTGRMVDGEEAVRIGLATSVSEDPHAAALVLARDLAGRSPDAVRAAKRLLNRSGRVPVAQQLLDESAEMGALIGSANQTEAVRAQLEGRRPVFADPRLGLDS